MAALRAAVVADRAAAAALLDGAGSEGGRALVIDARAGAPPVAGEPPAAGAERLSDHVRGRGEAVTLTQALLSRTWVLDTIEGLTQSFAGIAVTKTGRVWSAVTAELRQAPALGEERVLAERNRREELVRASEAAVQAELGAGTAVESSYRRALQARR